MASRTANHEKTRRLVVLGGRTRGEGRVSLVGAGPGDPELLTLKAARAIDKADVVIHDGLVSEEILALIPQKTRRISVAKRKSRHSFDQGEINRLLVGLAREGLHVVRLKGGDPLIFGRGGEEIAACRDAGVRCEVVPGITAALSSAAGALAPLTQRGSAETVSFVTAHGEGGRPSALDWPALARANHTVCFYMGLSLAVEIAERLIAAGRAASTPALLIENASRPQERRRLTTLAGLGAAAQGLSGPALILVGEAMAMAVSAEGEESPAVARERHVARAAR